MGVVGTVVSVLIFRNPINMGSVAGYAITLVGIALYIAAKRRQPKSSDIQKCSSLA